ncbi:hypothetical protein FH608_022210 [Nonomuraea phyllanthi]|uniref:Uncharacterized protein n=1 Tax=Nonomuraea phyllanthi TaxID=2219224 RepID=A0A5C4WE87_9ACTN|nr:hypothetical protein [Nonomuraea phyllanthi]KAB8193050.1 hypothetical protein FH608_022210 [Nonomuraea phyllanthi]QFY11088.1 hypothetical protein GBF35_34850 [Nonomuraea phyllanthi]
MRSRVPAVVLLLLSAFAFTGGHQYVHEHAVQAGAAWWSAPASTVQHQQDRALPNVQPVRGPQALPMWAAVLPPAWEPGETMRRVVVTTASAPAPPPAGRRLAPARAPPSTTR